MMTNLKFILLAVALILTADATWALPTSVTPTEAEIRCSTDNDCLRVSSSCDGCCQETAISKTSQGKFADKVSQCYKDWMNQPTPIVCDCSPVNAIVKCVAKKCVLKTL